MPLLALVSCSPESAAPDWSLEGLRVEHLEAPLGLDEHAPRFTWKLVSEVRGEKQSAYRILVSLSGDTVWDSGKVSSSDTTLVPYQGKPLEARARYQVEIEAWNRDGSASASAEARPFFRPRDSLPQAEASPGRYRLRDPRHFC